MKSTTARILGISALVLAAALFMNRPGQQSADNGKPRPTSAPPADSVPPNDTNKQVGSSSRRPTQTSGQDLRGQQLAQLKKLWLGMKDQASGSTIVGDLIARDELSKESARLLLCSPEAIQLIQFLETEGIENRVRSKIDELFDSDLAEEARQMLISLPDDGSGDETNYRQEWAGDAGKGCPPEKFEEFCSALGSASSVQAALFGHNITLAKTDPIGALTSTVNQFSAGLASANMNSSVKNLLKELPPGTDFEQIDRILAAQPETLVLHLLGSGRLLSELGQTSIQPRRSIISSQMPPNFRFRTFRSRQARFWRKISPAGLNGFKRFQMVPTSTLQWISQLRC